MGDTAHIYTIFKFLPHTRVNMGAFCLHKHPITVSCLYYARMVLSLVGSFAYFCSKCTLHSNHRLTVWYSNTQNDFSPGAVIFSLHTLASPSGRNVNYDEKQLIGGKIVNHSFYLYRFRKYMSYGSPIITFSFPGLHYETPCIMFIDWIRNPRMKTFDILAYAFV